MTKDKLVFDKNKHAYSVKGRKILSVTSVLPDIPEYLLYKQNFIEKTLLGNRVHDCAHIINKRYQSTGEIPDESVYVKKFIKESDGPYIKAYIKFLTEKKPVIHAAEIKMFHKLYNYAGTIDLVAELNNKLWVLDLKTTSKVAPYARLQLAAYLRMWNAKNMKMETFQRGIIHLKPDGMYSLISYPVKDLKNDTEIFLCKLRSAQWDIAHGVSKF